MIKLFEYQPEGVQFLAGRPFALLADEMGLGKTPQAIRACDIMGVKRVLVVTPAIATISWQREFAKFGLIPRRVQILDTIKYGIYGDVVICSYDYLIQKAVYKLVGKHNFNVTIFDEAHYLKSFESKRTRSILGNKCDGGGQARLKSMNWFLTGTPCPNGDPREIWPLLHFSGAYKKSLFEFTDEFCIWYEGEYGIKVTGIKNVNKLKELLKPIMLRRTKDMVKHNLKSITFRDVVIEKGVIDADLWAPEQDMSRPHVIATMRGHEDALRNIVLRQPTPTQKDLMTALEAVAPTMSTLRMFIGLAKVDGAVKLIKNDLDGGVQKIVIFAYHRCVIKALEYYLKDYGVVTIWGGTSPKRKKKNEDRFTNKPKIRVFIGQTEAAGTNINLAAAHNVVFVEPDWVPGNNAQAAMRVHRHPQKKPVLVRFLALDKSIDEHICKTFRRKAASISAMFD